MTVFTTITLVLGVLGFIAYGWALGVEDAGGETHLLRPWMGLTWGVMFIWLTLIEQARYLT